MGIDYYGVLSIKKNSADLEIKTAYRKLALQLNPEKLKDESTLPVFSLISEAYDVLSDPLKRAVFDQYGEEGLKRGVPGPNNYIQPYIFHGDPFKTYREFFGTDSPYADLLDYLINPLPLYSVPEGKGVKKKQETIFHPLQLTLHEVYHGGMKKMKIYRLVFISEDQTRTEIKEKILTVPIKPGLKAGTHLKCIEEGDQNPTQIPADVIFVMEEQSHEVFSRHGDDLVLVHKISLLDALSGKTITVCTLDDRTIRIPITDIVYPGYEKVVPGEGMPILETPQEKGNLIIKFDIEFPNYLPEFSRSMINKAFHMAEVGDITQPETMNKLILVDKMKRIVTSEQHLPVI